MKSHRVYVIWIYPLFLESLRLLLRNTDIEWIGACGTSENEYAEIHRLNPDTVLVEVEESGNLPGNVIDLLESGATDIRIFRLSLANNDLRIYHREKRVVMQAGDLLNLIREGE
jgi:hypothetical protein